MGLPAAATTRASPRSTSRPATCRPHHSVDGLRPGAAGRGRADLRPAGAARCPWAGCWPSCSRSPPCSTCTCGPSWCCCRRPWSPSRAWPAASTPSTTSGRAADPVVRALDRPRALAAPRQVRDLFGRGKPSPLEGLARWAESAAAADHGGGAAAEPRPPAVAASVLGSRWAPWGVAVCRALGAAFVAVRTMRAASPRGRRARRLERLTACGALVAVHLLLAQ